MDIGHVMKRKSISDSRSGENITVYRQKIEN